MNIFRNISASTGPILTNQGLLESWESDLSSSIGIGNIGISADANIGISAYRQKSGIGPSLTNRSQIGPLLQKCWWKFPLDHYPLTLSYQYEQKNCTFLMINFFKHQRFHAGCKIASWVISVEMISQMLLFGPSILYILLTGYTVILDLILG